MAENPIFHVKTNHVEVRYHFIIEKVLQKQITMRQIKTDNQIAGLFMKGLNTGKFENFHV